MFSGLNNFLKLILPKRLFYRSLIIVAAPIIILQIIVTIVFFDSVWIKANKGMTRALVAELKLLNDFYSDNKINIDFLTDSYKNNFDFEISILDEKMPEVSGERKYSPIKKIILFLEKQEGCYLSRMTGSGSACYGLFKTKKTAKVIQKKIKKMFPKYWTAISRTI